MSDPRALVLIDVSVWSHPLMDAELLRKHLSEFNSRSRTAVIGSMTANEDRSEGHPGEVAARYPAWSHGRRRTQAVLRGIDRNSSDALVLVGWWVDEEAVHQWAQVYNNAVNVIAGLDAVDEYRLAQAILGAALMAQETLF